VVDTINELSNLASKLNQKSDTLNKTIEGIEAKLNKLNLGVETWLESYDRHTVVVGDPTYDEAKGVTSRDETFLGFARFEDGWHLAIKDTVAEKNADGDFLMADVVLVRPLLTAPRNVRIKAMELIPTLLDAIKVEAESLLKAIDAAEEAAKKL